MGGSGGSSYRDWDSNQLGRALREDAEKAVHDFDVDLAGYFECSSHLFSFVYGFFLQKCRGVTLYPESVEGCSSQFGNGLV